MGEEHYRGHDVRLVTAEIIYHMPDYPDILQEFIWQHLDYVPDLPKLKRFLAFWETHIEGRLHTVRIARSGILISPRVCHLPNEFRFH